MSTPAGHERPESYQGPKITAEIKRLFPNCCYEFHRITLAPPITRKLAPVSWGLCLFFESLKIFNIIPFGDTHYLVAIRPLNTDDRSLITATVCLLRHRG